MSIQNEIINSGRKQKLKSPEVYRTGRVNNSGAYLRGPKADPTAGKGQASMANFIGGMSKMFDLGVNVQQDWVKDEEARGKAHYAKATPDQRKQLRDNIKTGNLKPSESYPWRQGVSIAHTKTLVGRYNSEMFKAYERGYIVDKEGKKVPWADGDNEYVFNKNDPGSGSFQAFIDKFDNQYKQDFEAIDEEILLEHFVPSQMGIQRQLRQRHDEHLNKEYIRKSMNAKESEVYSFLNSDSMSDVYSELNKGSFTIEDLVQRGGRDNETRLEDLTTIEDILMSHQANKPLSAEHKTWLMGQPGGAELLEELDKIKPIGKIKPPKKVGILEETKEYKVVANDNLTKIAQKLSKKTGTKITVEDLISKNDKLTEKSIIFPKMRLKY